MSLLQLASFARHKGTYFLERAEGVLIVPETQPLCLHPRKEAREYLQKKKSVLLEKKEHRSTDAKCMPRAVNEEGVGQVSCPCCEDVFAVEECSNYVTEHQKDEALGAVLENAEKQHRFVLATARQTDPVLLTRETTVFLSGLSVSDKLFFVLLKKTKTEIGERFSVFGHDEDADCIGEVGTAEHRPITLIREQGNERETQHVLENIEGIPENCIGCSFKRISLQNTLLGNILPKLRIHKEARMEMFSFVALKEEYTARILGARSIGIGKTRNIKLVGYGVGLLPRLKTNGDGITADHLFLNAADSECVAGTLAETENKSIRIGETTNLFLLCYSVNLLPRLRMGGDGAAVGGLLLNASESMQVAGTSKEENRSICIGETKNITLCNHAIRVLPKLGFHKENVLEGLFLFSYTRKEQSAEIFDAQEENIEIGFVKNMKLFGAAIGVLPRLRINKENVMCFFGLHALGGEQLQGILGEQDRSIYIGRVKEGGFDVPEEIRRKMKYILVHEEGNETRFLD
ncbi:MAG: uncharacterized protein A8A55_2112 [Amphiamblys sp. WSBS2006]|nr:MAG: uncharacterized protein A8A55_2112 [Amphiamblys sp. WSBS2006]